MELLLNDPEMHKKYTEKKGTTPFFEVCRHGLLGTAKKILELHSVDINQKTPSGWTALCAAAAHGHTAVVEFLLDQSTLSWEPQKQETLDPLYAACMNRNPDVVKLLLKDRRLVLPQDPELLEKLKKLSEEISCWVDEIQHGEREGLEHHFRTMTITNTAKGR
jgi:ankyrin repeat protein